MNWNYNDFLTEKLTVIARDLGYNGEILVSDELAFTKAKSYSENTIYFVVKRLTSIITNETETQPIQIICLCEQNSLVNATSILNQFVDENNWKIIETNESNVKAKQEYSKPVVISNFDEVGFGYRSVIYLTGNIFLIRNLLDVETITITADNKTTTFKPLNFTWSYVMTPNTQQEHGDNLSSSVKTVSVVSVSFSVSPSSNNFLARVINIAKGTTTGNEIFGVSFNFGSYAISYDMKLIEFSFDTSPNNIGGIRVGFIR